MTSDRKPKVETKLIQAGRDPETCHGAVNPPVYRTSTILMKDMAAWYEARRPGTTTYRYGLVGTPSSGAFEDAMAEIYGVERCIAVCSGLAMISMAFLSLAKAGAHILVTDSAYEPTRQFCDTVLKRFGVETTYYDPTIGSGIETLLRPETAFVFTETPGSLTFEVQDIPAIARAAHARNITVITDNTWATALRFNPFEHGADVVLEATTKYVAGHSDVLMGVILASGTLATRLHGTAKGLGICCSGDDLYLAQRGLRSLAVRLDRSEATGLQLATWLAERPEVSRVLHPALPGCPGHDIWQRDFAGSSGLFSMVLKPMSVATRDAFIDRLQLFGIGASWGGFESLIMPTDLSRIRTAVPWIENGPLLRLYAGLEAPDDLIADLDQAFEALS